MEPNNNRVSKLNPKFFFVSAGVLISLIASITSFLGLVFATLNKKFPDVLNSVYQYGYNTYDYAALRGALATLIIIFPVFLFLSYIWNKLIHEELGQIDAIIKKWMLYLIIFLSSVVIIVDLITLVRYFVEGEITIRFVLKTAITLFVALLTGLYYFYQLREIVVKRSTNILFTAIAVILFIVSIVTAFMVIGSPAKQRLLRTDERRIQDLQSIQWQVITHWQQKEKLPEKLADLANPLSGYSLPVDPEFEKGKQYEYTVKGPLTFELCATFALPMPKGWSENTYGVRPPSFGFSGREMMDVSYPYPGPSGMNESWAHEESGRICFERTIDKDLYPPYPKPSKE